jgi:hypothetical protein
MTDAALIAFFSACTWLGFGLLRARREAALCRADNARHGEAAPVWPVWLVVTALWPMLEAQRGVLWALTLWDAAAAGRADNRGARRG